MRRKPSFQRGMGNSRSPFATGIISRGASPFGALTKKAPANCQEEEGEGGQGNGDGWYSSSCQGGFICLTSSSLEEEVDVDEKDPERRGMVAGEVASKLLICRIIFVHFSGRKDTLSSMSPLWMPGSVLRVLP